MSTFQRQYVSKLVPSNTKLLTTIIIAVAVVNSATLGYDSSVMNGLQILPSYTEYFDLTVATTGLNNAASWMGAIMATPMLQFLPDKFGRKNAIVASAAVCIVGIILQAAAQNIAMFVIARIIVGLGATFSSGAAPALISELMPAVTRGRILGFFFSCFYVGSLASAIINYGSQNIQSTWSWRLPSLLQLIPSLMALCLLPFIPESPRWLVANGQPEHALEILIVTQGNSDPNSEIAQETFAEIQNAITAEKTLFKQNPWIEIWSTVPNRKRLAILCTFGVMINSFGNFVVSFYLGKILDQAGITKTKTQTQINVILSCWSFAVALVGSYSLDYIGRRRQALVCIAGMIVCLYAIGGMIKVFGTSTNKSGIYGTIAFIFFFQGFYAFSITPLTSVYPSEISQYKLRMTGIAIFRFLDSGFGLLASFALSYAMADLGWKFYMINASYNILFFVIIYFLWVETNGLTLEEIALKFEGEVALTAGREAINADSESSETESQRFAALGVESKEAAVKSDKVDL
ncbi:general substrate transporter [Leptodontidium sp. 2 PMI_412]|nr:hexose transporter [Leptodontidium sp. MPI-SDFR-AT-0119]KAH9219130.1 general substrate transporter [Leptodontidium sp. 2 PMI_412]